MVELETIELVLELADFQAVGVHVLLVATQDLLTWLMTTAESP
jgi:hypothetical protein